MIPLMVIVQIGPRSTYSDRDRSPRLHLRQYLVNLGEEKSGEQSFRVR